MARPKKQTVDYFPHSCTHGKTMFIIEQKYGNDGYAFWFKLLELLGDTAGHYIDLNDEATQEFLQAKTLISWDLCREILDLLAKLGAIDAELWENKIVWSQNYVDGISDVYKNRRTEIPSRPSFYIEKPHDADISTGENPQSKVKKSKGKESNVSHKKIIDSLRKNVRADIRKDEIDLVTSWLDDGIETDVVIWAIEQAATNKKRNVQYINGILRNLHSENVLTMERVKEREKSHKKPEKEERFDFEKYKEEALRLVAKYDDAI